jgi:hypothetical protein
LEKIRSRKALTVLAPLRCRLAEISPHDQFFAAGLPHAGRKTFRDQTALLPTSVRAAEGAGAL